MTFDTLGRPRRGRPPARNEILRSGRLAGLDPRELADRFGTPLYIYDLDVIDRQVAALRAAIPEQADLAYAVKANPALAIAAHLGGLGLGADVASSELRSFLALADEWERALVLALLDTRLRMSELASLLFGDVGPEGTLHVMGPFVAPSFPAGGHRYREI